MRYLLTIAALALGACREDAPASAPPPPASGVTCDANGVRDLVGKPRSDALAEDARRRSGARAVRFLSPGQVTTMEYRGDRLNLRVDTAGKVTGASCG